MIHTTTRLALSLLFVLSAATQGEATERLPNIVLVFTDDQGYGDVGCFGAKDFETPNLDRLARGGMKFTSFYVAQPVCGASRAALLTGCYPNRIGLRGAPSHTAKHGIHERETTIAELVKQKEYATAIFGKWHLGHLPPFLPLKHGFDEYYGLPYSNDMWPFHPTNGGHYPKLPLIEGSKVIELNPDQSKLTTSYAERAVKFIDKNKDKPFFLYVAHSMPHVPLFVSSKYKGKSKQGLYGDVIQEIDWSVGEIVRTLEKHDLRKDTLIIFTTDNGPWLSYGHHAGSAGPLREGKGTTWDGGVRVPCIMNWPGRIPAGKVCDEPAMTIDVLPTIAHLTGAKLPDHKIDGKSIWPLMAGHPKAKSPHDALFFYYGRNLLEAMRAGKWKLHFPHGYRTMDGRPGGRDGKPNRYSQKKTGLELYDLSNDIGEKSNVAAEHPDVVARLQKLADGIRAELGDSGKRIKPSAIRPAGKI